MTQIGRMNADTLRDLTMVTVKYHSLTEHLFSGRLASGTRSHVSDQIFTDTHVALQLITRSKNRRNTGEYDR